MTVQFGDGRLPERFWRKVEIVESGCWEWRAQRQSEGYARFYWQGTQVYAHRLVCELFVANPTGLYVDHKCRNRACVNPEHLHPATPKQNQEHRGLDANNTSGYRGVVWASHAQLWRVNVEHGGRRYFGGYFHGIEDANRAAIALRNRLFTNNLLDRQGVA